MMHFVGEFRGTKQSLKELINEDRNQPALLVDIWQFYRAERLHLLQVIKEIISQGQDDKHPHFDQFQNLLKLLSERDIKSKIFAAIASGCEVGIAKQRFQWDLFQQPLPELVDSVQLEGTISTSSNKLTSSSCL